MAGSALDLYYHAKMHDYEIRQKTQKQAIIEKRKISKKEKKELLQITPRTVQEWFQATLFSNEQHPASFETYHQFKNYIQTYSFTNCFRSSVPVNMDFPCLFFEGNRAWIHRDSTGHVRYYSKKKQELSISFDFLDLIEISERVSTLDALLLLQEWGNIEIQESREEAYLRSMHRENLAIYQEMTLKGTSHTSKFLSSLLPVYEELQILASTNSNFRSEIIEGSVFFASTRYMAERIGNLHHSTVSRMVHALDAAGFIKKLEAKDIPTAHHEKAKEWANMMGYRNHVGFYQIPSLQSIKTEVSDRLRLIKKAKLTYRDFTSTTKNKLFGFIQEEPLSKEAAVLQERFVRLLTMKGHVSKQFLLKGSKNPTAKKVVERHWKNWLEQFDCLYIKPTTDQKKEFHLKTSQYIAIKKESSSTYG